MKNKDLSMGIISVHMHSSRSAFPSVQSPALFVSRVPFGQPLMFAFAWRVPDWAHMKSLIRRVHKHYSAMSVSAVSSSPQPATISLIPLIYIQWVFTKKKGPILIFSGLNCIHHLSFDPLNACTISLYALTGGIKVKTHWNWQRCSHYDIAREEKLNKISDSGQSSWVF